MADSLSVRPFLHLELQDPAPDHAPILRTRRLIELETHTAVFTWILERLAAAGLVTGADDRDRCPDARSERGVAEYRAAGHRRELRGISDPPGPGLGDCAAAARARRRRGWIGSGRRKGPTPMGPTRHKAEQAVDLDTGAIVGVTIQPAATGDTQTLVATVRTAAEQVEAVQPAVDAVREVVGAKGYHSNQTLLDLEARGVRAYRSAPDRGRRTWRGTAAARDAVSRTRRRLRGARGQRLLRQRGARLERPFAGNARRIRQKQPEEVAYDVLQNLIIYI